MQQQQQQIQPSLSSSTSKSGPVLVSVESPLPPIVQRSLGDRSYDKRKNAALEIEQLVKSLSEAHNVPMIQSIISVLAKDFCTSMNANYRKGGLIGIAATAIGLMGNTRSHLEGLLFPVLHCFDDPESRVRYYACESLYNIAKVARGSILRYFNQIFDGLTKLFADVDVDVKNGANLLDRLVKDIVTESETFHVEHFLPLLQTYIRRTNPYIRQLLVGWITVLDSVPDISMIDYLPDFLDGLFNMLSDSNREIRQAADSALSDFLKEVRHSTVLEFGPLVSILVNQCMSKDRLNRLTAITWIEELIHHPYSGGDALLPHHSEVLDAILYCISDSEEQICIVAERTNANLISLVRDTQGDFQLAPLLRTLTEKLMTKDDVPTKMASLRWINMLLEKRRGDMTQFVPKLLTVLLKTLSDTSDSVVLFTLQVLARISLGDGGGPIDDPDNLDDDQDKRAADTHYGLLRGTKDEKHFKLVINAVLGLFSKDRALLENRGSLVVRKFCVLLDAESVYMLMAQVLSSSCQLTPGRIIVRDDETEMGPSADEGKVEDPIVFSLEFMSTMVQTLNLILLTASELHGLRVLLAKAFDRGTPAGNKVIKKEDKNANDLFDTLFKCWCHSPVATFSFCLLARAYEVAFDLVQKFSELDVSVGFLMQIDKLVQLLESPVFVHLRLQLLDVESPHHAPLLKSCYGLLMLLPQSDAFRSLNDRLTTVCNLRDNLGIPPVSLSRSLTPNSCIDAERQAALLSHFDKIMGYHRRARRRDGILNPPDDVAPKRPPVSVKSGSHYTNGEPNFANPI
jgi:vacuole morphology and inheritance protein 14